LAIPRPAGAAADLAGEGAPGQASAKGDIGAIRMLEPGAVAPDFLVRDTAGEAFHFEKERERYPYLIVFWSMFCEPCRLQLTAIQRLYGKYRDDGLRVAAVAMDGEPLKSVVAGFVRQEGYTFQVLLDELDGREMYKVADPYGVAGMPSTFLVGRDGRVAFGRAGLVKEEELAKAVQSVLKP
jgi:peroxiredoxin